MRDVKIISFEIDGISFIDLDIINGEPVWLDEASQTNDQRAALACYACKGTVPGLPDYGVSWGSVYDKSDTTVQLNNELQQQLTSYVGSAETDSMLPQTQYNATLLQDSGGIGVLIQRGGQ